MPRLRLVAAALCLTMGGLGLAGCSDVRPAPDREGVFTFGEENWLEAPGWTEALPSETDMVGADLGIATGEGEEPGTQLFIEVYASMYPGEHNRDQRHREISVIWRSEATKIRSLEVDGHTAHGLTYEIIEPDRVVEEYYLDGDSSIYRVLIETPRGPDQTTEIENARRILTEHTVLNDGERS